MYFFQVFLCVWYLQYPGKNCLNNLFVLSKVCPDLRFNKFSRIWWMLLPSLVLLLKNVRNFRWLIAWFDPSKFNVAFFFNQNGKFKVHLRLDPSFSLKAIYIEVQCIQHYYTIKHLCMFVIPSLISQCKLNLLLTYSQGIQ